MRIFIIAISIVIPFYSTAQIPKKDSIQSISLEECIRYALDNQPVIKQSRLDEEINHRTIRSSLASWLPQVKMDFAIQHYFILPVSLFPNFNDITAPRIPVRIGVPNTSNALFQLDQVLYSNEVTFASRAARFSKALAKENITNNQINVIVNVSKAFYDVLLTEQQQNVIHQTIEREKILLRDARRQYEIGITDKIDYMRTSISLNLSQADERRSQEALTYKYAFLKQLMGFPSEKKITLAYDNKEMGKAIFMDTTVFVNYKERIEYQLLNTQMSLQKLNVQYYQFGFLPSASFFANYNFIYQSTNIENLYKIVYPSSAIGIRLSIPLYQGGKRFQNIQIAKLQERRLGLDLDLFKAKVETEYSQSLGTYKSNLNDLKVQEENVQVANEVYTLLKFQYDQGIKPYIDVISSETDLRTSQINYLNALYNVLSAKLDFMRTLGTINISP